MKIKILYFAQLRQLFEKDEQTLNVPEGICVQAAVDMILEGKESAGLDWGSVKYAVNEEFADGARTLQDQDTLVLLPPVSGG